MGCARRRTNRLVRVSSRNESVAMSATELGDLRDEVERSQPEYLRDLEQLVNIDCGSYTKAGVDDVGRFVAGFLREQLGAEIELDANERLGDTIIGRLSGAVPDGPRLLLIGHMDTVFDPGTAAERPFRMEKRIATGPGVTDMKSGLLAGLYALRALARVNAGQLPFGSAVFIANPDEEIGSPVS